VGLKLNRRRTRRSVGVFQTNPRGVEAATGAMLSQSPGLCFRRTLVGLKRTQASLRAPLRTSFRRTLVGLKPPLLPGDGMVSAGPDVPFQTNPRGVEAPSSIRTRLSELAFQTNPRGVEATDPPVACSRSSTFQTNPRGVEAGWTGCPWSSRGFQTNPRGVEARPVEIGLTVARRFRRTLVGLKPDVDGGTIENLTVSDEPSWG